MSENSFIDYRKIKINNNGVSVTYESIDDDEESHLITYTCKQQPRVDFYRALKAIAHQVHSNYNLSGSCVEADLRELALKQTEQGTDASFTFKLLAEDWQLTNKVIQKNIGADLESRIKAFLEEVAIYAKLNNESEDDPEEESIDYH